MTKEQTKGYGRPKLSEKRQARGADRFFEQPALTDNSTSEQIENHPVQQNNSNQKESITRKPKSYGIREDYIIKLERLQMLMKLEGERRKKYELVEEAFELLFDKYQEYLDTHSARK